MTPEQVQFEPGMDCPSCGGWMDFMGVNPSGDGVYACEDIDFCFYSLEINPETQKEVGIGW